MIGLIGGMFVVMQWVEEDWFFFVCDFFFGVISGLIVCVVICLLMLFVDYLGLIDNGIFDGGESE